MVKELIPVVHHDEEELEWSVFHVQLQFVFDSLNTIETKIAQCLQIQHDEDDIAKFYDQWCQMLQIYPEALVLRFCLHLLQRVDHLSLTIGQSQCYDMDDMLIGN